MLRPPKTLRAHQIETTRTARYYTLGEPDGDVSDVWIVCHGYSQLAEKFIHYFEALDDGKTLVVAPEALSLFYLNRFAAAKGDASKVGATWMTGENRLGEIRDYVAYLELLHSEIFSRVDRSRVRLTALGFSQGAATISRWVTETDCEVDRLVLWAGRLPPDMDLGSVAAKLRSLDFQLVVGQGDELISEAQLHNEEKRLAQYGIPYRLTTFDGGHHMSLKTLRELADRGRPGQ